LVDEQSYCRTARRRSSVRSRPPTRRALRAFHERQPRDNQYRGFLSPKPTLTDKELDHFTHIDFHDRVAPVVENRGEFIAWASYERWMARDDAEVAFMVDGAHQGRGIATILLEHLAAIACSNGIDRFTAEGLSDNAPMLRVFSRAGWPVERHFDTGLTEIELPLTDTEHFVDSVEEREHRADSRAVARLLLRWPKSTSTRPSSARPNVWRPTRGSPCRPTARCPFRSAASAEGRRKAGVIQKPGCAGVIPD